MREIRKVAVLGAGTMGARIAAHLANAGIPSVLLDIVPQELNQGGQGAGSTSADPRARNRLAQAGLDAALKSKPAAFFSPENARLIKVGNFEDHLKLVKDCDWIIEAVTEDRAIKQALLKRVDALRTPGAVVTSNTSGISIASIAEGLSEDFRRHWLGTHFFNPPRYMRLLELIPTADTLPQVVESIARFGEVALGKGIVIAKDTPNFIANRIGTFVTLNVLRMVQVDGREGGYTIEELDALTGPAMGLPKSATFRTLDLVGLDVLVHVVDNLRQSLPHDERRELFELPPFVAEMMKRKLLGDKTQQGFYKKVKAIAASGEDSEIRTLDLATYEYRPRQKPRLASLEIARNIEDPRQRVASLIASADRVGEFYRRLLSNTFHYTANQIPEIADSIVTIDEAMKWGYNWELGVFELWDAVGVEKVVEGWLRENRPVPPLAAQLLDSGQKAFYKRSDGVTFYFDQASSSNSHLPEREGIILLRSLKEQSREVRKNAGASLIDLGDGVLCLEFHSKMNTIGADTVSMIHAGLKALNENFDALVIGNQAANFSVGANLMLLLVSIQEGEWDDVHQAVRTFQSANMALKYAHKPVVAAPFGLTLGGGTEICLHCTRVRAAVEAYMGLVEFGVGLIPAGGGTKEMLVRAMDTVPEDPDADAFSYVKEVFETIGMAKVSTSAQEARELGYLSPRDSVTMNRDRLIADAKNVALDLVRLGYRTSTPREDVTVLGQAAFSKMKLGLHLMRRAEFISDHDVVVGTELARVLSGGGEFTSPQRVSEQYLLDLEREAFVRLCGQPKTVERIQYTLKKGKPLRN
ncbi:MAG TPA: 3-hydroxyacyl-CoA dehydrogenase/enoyl-CoA hydratase family protein [Terriglobia bacterium]|nr:3-hydroxyacyl-CoA dehydrogenase/enoyl-CoA hydratase family protein [Terriglobia bacterium]